MNDTDDIFSRETLAGYDRNRLERACLVLVGAGAAANNFALTTALAGVGEHRVIDFDVVEPSNVTRSPFFRMERLGIDRARFKARELARGILSTSYATAPIVRYANRRVEALGYGAFLDASVIVSAVDSHAVRAYLADAARFLGVPLVEMGFSGFDGQVSVFPNASPEEPCWRCLVPHVTHGGFSCTAYARAVTDAGRVPATQTVAAVIGGLAAQAAIDAVHGEFPLGGRVLTVNVKEGRSRVLGITPNPCCPGVHRTTGDVRTLAATCNEPLRAVFEEAREFTRDPVVHLPGSFVVRAPCARCGAGVAVHRPAWAVNTPQCAECGSDRDANAPPAQAVVVQHVETDHPLAGMKVKRFGLPSAAIFEIEDTSTGTLHAVRLGGSIDDLFVTATRRTRHDPSRSRMDPDEATSVA